MRCRPYRALVLMLTETGARPGEAIALRVKNLNGSVRIAEATVEVGGKKITGTPKTKGGIRKRAHFPPGYGPHSGTTMTRAMQTGLTLTPTCSPPKVEPRSVSPTYVTGC